MNGSFGSSTGLDGTLPLRSLRGQLRKSRTTILMSVKRPKAEVARRHLHFRYVPQAEVAMPVVGVVHSIKSGHSYAFSLRWILPCVVVSLLN